MTIPPNEFLGICEAWIQNTLQFAIRSTGAALVLYSDLGRSRSRSSQNPAAQAAGLSETMQPPFAYVERVVEIPN